MLKKLNIFVVFLFVSFLSSCSVNEVCDCEIPGPALIKVFLADDGVPNVNIEAAEVYPGQEVVFSGLDEFSLTFDRDPQDPKIKNKTYRSKKGQIVVKVSKMYDDILKIDRYQKGYRIVRAEPNAEGKDGSDYLYIKYDVSANGKTRDPGLKIFPK